MVKKIVIPIVAALVAVIVAVGAAVVVKKIDSEKKFPYNATLFDIQSTLELDGSDMDDQECIFKKEFLESNMTYRAYYKNKNYGKIDENGFPEIEEFFVDKTSPKSHYYIITSQEQLDEMYEKCPTVDFQKEMLFVWIKTFSESTAVYLQDVKIENGIIKIDLFQPRSSVWYMSKRRIIVVKTDKVDVSSVEFNLSHVTAN